MNIPINTVGLFRSGEYPGWYVKVLDEDDGGFLVLLAKHKDFTGGPDEGYDYWFLSSELEAYFSSVEVEWLPREKHQPPSPSAKA